MSEESASAPGCALVRCIELTAGQNWFGQCTGTSPGGECPGPRSPLADDSQDRLDYIGGIDVADAPAEPEQK